MIRSQRGRSQRRTKHNSTSCIFSICHFVTFFLGSLGLCFLMLLGLPFYRTLLPLQLLEQPLASRSPELWDYDAVYEFVANIGAGDVWQDYAQKLRDDSVDGSTLMVLEAEDLAKYYSIHTPHANTLLRKLQSAVGNSEIKKNKGNSGTLRRLYDKVNKITTPPRDIPKVIESPRLSVVVISQDEQHLMDRLIGITKDIDNAIIKLENMEATLHEIIVQHTDQVKHKIDQLIGQLRKRSDTLIDEIVLAAEEKITKLENQKNELKKSQQTYASCIQKANDLLQSYTGFGKPEVQRKQIISLVQPLLSNIPDTRPAVSISLPLELDTTSLETGIKLFGNLNSYLTENEK